MSLHTTRRIIENQIQQRRNDKNIESDNSDMFHFGGNLTSYLFSYFNHVSEIVSCRFL